MPKVKKREYKIQISQQTLMNWKIAGYYGMYADIVDETGIADYTLREAIKRGYATPTTEKAIDKFFAKRTKQTKRS